MDPAAPATAPPEAKPRFAIILGHIIAILLFAIPSAAVIIPLVHYAQGQPFDRSQCTARETSCGFVGNSDFYGLGIRLGIYLQWFASLILNTCIPSERRAAATAYCVFSLALFIALFVITFQTTCTYEAEIIIILFLYFGGVYNVLAPLVRKEMSATSSRVTALTFVFGVILFPMTLYSSWFWVQLGTGNSRHFQPTPCGTSLFLFSHVGPHHFMIASKFMAFISIWLTLTPAFHITSSLLVQLGFVKVAAVLEVFSFGFFLVLFNTFVGACFGLCIGIIAGVQGEKGLKWLGERVKPVMDELCVHPFGVLPRS